MTLKKQMMKNDAGFSLLESLVAIVVFGLVVTTVGSSLVMAHRINARSEVLMQEQLRVSRTVEMIMAKGIDPSIDDTDDASAGENLNTYYQAEYGDDDGDHIADLTIDVSRGVLNVEEDLDGDGISEPLDGAFYKVTVTSVVLPEQVSVTTYVRPVEGSASSQVATESGGDGES